MTRASIIAIALAPALSLAADDKTAPAEETVAIDPAAYRQIEVLMRAIETVRENYVDAEKVSYEQLVEDAIEGMFARLDSHSHYMSPRLFEEARKVERNPRNTTGIVLTTNKTGDLIVASVTEAGPAARAGVRSGDRLLKIGEREVDASKLTESTALLDGRPGELITIVIQRPGGGRVRTFGFERENPAKETVTGAEMLPPEMTGKSKIGYARITQFESTTARELADALDKLEDGGMQALVLDLRANPGGLLSAAIEVCAEFVPPKTLIAQTEGRPGTENSETYHSAATQRRQRDYPMAVLINKSSASSSEIVAGALKDLGRAIAVGTTTFGKGSVQTVIPMGLETGAAMRLTTARFYTPKHRPIDGHGIEPDIEITGDQLPITAAAKALQQKLAAKK
jgi:carboxyl-terminal processing protease